MEVMILIIVAMPYFYNKWIKYFNQQVKIGTYKAVGQFLRKEICNITESTQAVPSETANRCDITKGLTEFLSVIFLYRFIIFKAKTLKLLADNLPFLLVAQPPKYEKEHFSLATM